jgi:mRNA interferase HigB
MRVIKRSTLVDFSRKHPETRDSLERWCAIAKRAHWASMADVQASFSSAKIINGERARFEIHGGDYRMIVAFYFPGEIAYVKFIGTHKEYDRIDAEMISDF